MIVDLSDDNVSFLIEIIRRLMPKKTDSQAAGALHDDESMLTLHRLEAARTEICRYLSEDIIPK